MANISTPDVGFQHPVASYCASGGLDFCLVKEPMALSIEGAYK